MVWKACPSGRAGPLVRSGTQSWRRGPVSYEAAGRPGRSGPRAVMGSAGVDSARTRAGGAAGGPLRPPGWLHGCPAPQAQEGGQEAAPEARTATEGTSWGPGAARGDTAGRPVPAGGDPGRRGSGASPPPPPDLGLALESADRGQAWRPGWAHAILAQRVLRRSTRAPCSKHLRHFASRVTSLAKGHPRPPSPGSRPAAPVVSSPIPVSGRCVRASAGVFGGCRWGCA